MRIIEILNKEVFEGLKEKDKMVSRGRKISTEIEKLEEERNRIGMGIQKIKDRIIPLVVKEMEAHKLGEYEEISEIIASKKSNTVEVQVFDQIEAYKEFLDDKKKEKEEQERATNEHDGASEQLSESAPDSPEGD